jgi:hypothetical protein
VTASVNKIMEQVQAVKGLDIVANARKRIEASKRGDNRTSTIHLMMFKLAMTGDLRNERPDVVAIALGLPTSYETEYRKMVNLVRDIGMEGLQP